MGLFKVESGTPPLEIDPGSYNAVLTGVKPVTITVEGEERDCFEWVFDIEDPDGQTVEIKGLTSNIVSPGSKCVAYITALRGVAPAVGDELDVGDVIGRPCLVQIGTNKRGYPTVKNVLAAPRQARARQSGGAQQDAPTQQRQPVRVAAGDPGDDDLPF